MRFLGLLMILASTSCTLQPIDPQPPTTVSDQWTLDRAVDSLATQLVGPLPPSSLSRIAVLEPEPLAGDPATPFERYLADELTTRLFRGGRAQVVERTDLRRVLDELDLATSPAVDPSAASKLGQLVGADYVVSGRTADMGHYIRVSMRALDVRTGAVVSTAVADVTNSWAVARLRGWAPNQRGQPAITPGAPGPASQPSPGRTGVTAPAMAAGTVFVDVRADAFAVGDHPQQWGGALTVLETNHVKYLGLQATGRTYVTATAEFPPDWSLTVAGVFASDVNDEVLSLVLYDVGEKPYKLEFRLGAYNTSVTLATGESGAMAGRVREIRLVSQGGVLKVYNDDTFLASGLLREHGRFHRVAVSVFKRWATYGVVAIRAQAL